MRSAFAYVATLNNDLDHGAEPGVREFFTRRDVAFNGFTLPFQELVLHVFKVLRFLQVVGASREAFILHKDTGCQRAPLCEHLLAFCIGIRRTDGWWFRLIAVLESVRLRTASCVG